MKYTSIVLLILTICFSCNDGALMTASQAENLVKDHLDHNSLYETANFSTNKMKLNSKKDADLIQTIRDLEDEDYIEIVEKTSRKKWFSGDSVFIITPRLTSNALPYVVEQYKNRTKVKTLIYELDESAGIIFNKKNDKVASFNAVLVKKKTPFYSFGKDRTPNSTFITKTYKARYTEEKGWILAE